MDKVSYYQEGVELTIAIYGRVDTTNALEIESEINRIIGFSTYEELTIDADCIEYISSVGIRVLLKLMKANPKFQIINAPPVVYEVFEITGLTEVANISKGYRHLDVDDCKVIGEGAKGIVYRYDEDTIVKVYKLSDCLPIIERERELARKAFVLGVPTALSYDIVKVNGNFGTVFELLDSKSLSEMILEDPSNIEGYATISANLLLQIHSIESHDATLPDVKDMVEKWLDGAKPFLTDEQNSKVRKLVDDVPDSDNLLHCDYHSNNIIMQGDEALLIDMDTMSHGNPIFELANIYITYVGFGEVDPVIVEKFSHISYDMALKFWDFFIKRYLRDSDANIEDVTNKAALLAYLRLIRHTARRGITTESDRNAIKLGQERIGELLQVVDSLTF